MNYKIKQRKEHDNVYLNAKRIVSIMLALLLLFSITPAAFGTNAEPVEELQTPETGPPDEFLPDAAVEETELETIEIEGEPPLELTDDETTDDEIVVVPNEDIMLLSATTGNLMFFNLSKPDYTVRMGTQVAVTYPENGNGALRTAYIKNLGWHYASPNKNHTIYCIEPYKNFGESTSYNAVDEGVTLNGSEGTHGESVWYNLPLERRQAIALILLYSNERWDHSVDVTSTSRDNNPNVSLRVATQFLIYEIVTGLRDANTFNRLSSNGYTNGDVFYNAGVNNVWNFETHYNALEASITAHLKIPSFTSKSSGSAPIVALTGETTAVTDTNGVLSKFTFSNGNGAVFSKSGNTLTITQNGTISDTTIFSCGRNLFSPEASTYKLWYSPYISSYQTCISLHGEVTGEMKAYFKLKADSKGAIEIIKSTNTGESLNGWTFDVYKDQACTQLYGTYTSGTDGKVKIPDVPLGTYYIRERATDDAYWVCDTDTKTVTVVSNQTAAARFTNHQFGKGIFHKETNTNENQEGWQITIYRDAECSDPIETVTTATDGSVSLMLDPGTYFAKETGDIHGRFENEYWVIDDRVQQFEVLGGTDTAVTFSNNNYGKAKITKLMPTGGSTAGWGFEVRRANDNSLIGTYTTSFEGTVTTGLLDPGEYIITEIIPEGSFYKNVSPNPQTITVVEGETVEIAMTNVLMPGEINIKKINHEGTVLKGVEFLLEWSKDNTNWSPVTFSDSEYTSEGGCTTSGLADGKLVTDANGYVSFTGLHPQLHYRVTEVSTLEGYQLLSEPAFEGTLSLDNNLKVDLQVVNCPEYQLPMTGDNSLMHFAMLATAMMGFAVCTTYFNFKKRKD